MTQYEFDQMCMERIDPSPLRFNSEGSFYPPYRAFFIGGCHHKKDMIFFNKPERYSIADTRQLVQYEENVDPLKFSEPPVSEYRLFSVRSLYMESKFFNINLDKLRELYRCDKEILIYRERRYTSNDDN